MKNLLNLSIMTIMVLSFFACEQPVTEPPIDMEAVKSEIAAMEAAYAEASNANDADAVMAYYADDAQSMPPNRPTMVGAEAIKASIMANMEKDTSGGSLKLEVNEVWAAGDYAVETGIWTSLDADGNTQNTGKYMSLFEKRDGKYVCIRDMYNADSKPEKKEDMEEEAGEETGDDASEE